MYDSGKIIPGLAVFVLLITFPIWYNLVGGVGEVQSATHNKIAESHEAFETMLQSMGITFPNGARHSLSTQEMRVTHMDMLQDIHANVPADMKGQMPSMKCLVCHPGSDTTKQPLQFCDSCHAYAAVKTPDCWACHAKP